MDQIDQMRINELADRIVMLEKLVCILLYTSKEGGNFWLHTNREEQQLAADFYDRLGRQ
jgi:hypothetical protein